MNGPFSVSETAPFASKFDKKIHISRTHRPEIQRYGRSLKARGFVIDTVSHHSIISDDMSTLLRWENKISSASNIRLRTPFYSKQYPHCWDLRECYRKAFAKDRVTSHLWRDGEGLCTHESMKFLASQLTDNALLMFTFCYFDPSPQVKLCALYGGRGLFLLKEIKGTGTHNLITGDCFVDGLENGQGTELAWKMGLHEEEFCIY
ncbi:hypothetical protein GJ744_012395 [Endocarpon pusillum]|uniref:Uncharacterized protein n=1 Tax=Endocarpon pusillum TaxID=364733 RepID=A0A8H7AB78_9EURO|nr:hypothetical protein GJ744_012395 [Endocarpon pusillum]